MIDFSPWVSTVYVWETKEKQMSRMFAYHSSFHWWIFFVLFPERYTVNRERNPEGMYVLVFFFREECKAQMKMSNFYVASGLLLYIVCLSSLDLV